MKRQMKVLYFLALWFCLGTGCGIAMEQDGGFEQKGDIPSTGIKKQRIVSGAETGERFGAVVSLYMNGSQAQGDIHCSGTLITPQKVLTAAHCVKSQFLDSQGRILISVWVPQLPVIYVSGKPFAHPNYNSTNLDNDIAIIVLEEAVDFGFSKPLSISTTAPDDRNPYPHNTTSSNSIQHIVGFGHNQCRVPLGGVIPEYSTTYPISRRYGILETHATSSSSMTIRGEARHYIREVDSGGPLLIYREGGYQVTGVTSYYQEKVPGKLRYSCSDHDRNSNEFTGFVRVSKYAHWIQGVSIRTLSFFGMWLCLEEEQNSISFNGCNGSAKQQWVYEPETYLIRLVGTNKCLQASSSSIGVGECSTGLNLLQKWLVEGPHLVLAATGQVFSFEFPLFNALHFSNFVLRNRASGDLVSVELARSTYRNSVVQSNSTTRFLGSRNENLTAGQWKFYKLHIPHPFTAFSVDLRTDSGDPDMFIRKGPGYATTTQDADCSMRKAIDPSKPEQERWETCTVTSGQPGTWYLAVQAYGAGLAKYRMGVRISFAGTAIRGAKLEALPELGSQQAITDFVGSHQWKYYRMKNPQIAVVTAENLTGDVDIYVRKGLVPTLTSYDHRSYQGGTTPETIWSGSINGTTPNTDWWYVGVYGYGGGKFTLKADVRFFKSSLGYIPEPRFAGERVDRCLKGSDGCGQPAADRYCQLIGCTRATSFLAESTTSQNTLMFGDTAGSGAELPQICTSNNCRAFSRIVCCGSSSTCQNACP